MPLCDFSKLHLFWILEYCILMKFMRRRRKQVWKLVMLWRTICLVFYVHYIFFCDSKRLRRSATGTQWSKIWQNVQFSEVTKAKINVFWSFFEQTGLKELCLCGWKISKSIDFRLALGVIVEPLAHTLFFALFYSFLVYCDFLMQWNITASD